MSKATSAIDITDAPHHRCSESLVGTWQDERRCIQGELVQDERRQERGGRNPV